jgi:magnesium-transporting ATPase (P-type)
MPSACRWGRVRGHTDNHASAQGGSYIDTCNLDGETNLKIKSSLAATSSTAPDKVLPTREACRAAAASAPPTGATGENSDGLRDARACGH